MVDHPQTLKRNFEFFFDHAGYVVGERAKGALRLARAEKYASDHDWTYSWTWDDDADWSWLEQEGFENERKRDHEVFNCVLRDENGDRMESLCGIFDPDDNYRRVIEAELASEAMHREEELDRVMRI